MAIRRVGSFLKNAWSKEPVIMTSLAIGSIALITAAVSPMADTQARLNKAVPYKYPVPVRDDGNMPDIPSHPSDKIGPSLEWMKKL
ncbi:NADH dehydrogenase [ubiquinone] 1 alpha subcomplex subunit 3-like [Carcharodon carcharias]|uniref:NADH dehydrogenase [ubiquinone] 1 alpha subcomplex subunit 3-like n=1 Tax=Carcharodon carcharias TaxID=13397 RepID=UPI001B7E62D8|nr:NADH dehydrogenase [ubiquinone] 1 alpha subcomplex subunit 3-like [Carcharodon carcharias]